MSAIESEGTRPAIILAVTVWPFSSSSILFASRTKSIFHCARGGPRAIIAASNRNHCARRWPWAVIMRPQQRTAGQLGATEPRAARPGNPAAGTVSRPAGDAGCQRHDRPDRLAWLRFDSQSRDDDHIIRSVSVTTFRLQSGIVQTLRWIDGERLCR